MAYSELVNPFYTNNAASILPFKAFPMWKDLIIHPNKVQHPDSLGLRYINGVSYSGTVWAKKLANCDSSVY